ncbi:vWA domain-containing protein [Nitritalea halalkaliphila]|nr:VWA domain-containing protein [Nitritalea halalkaliphila]
MIWAYPDKGLILGMVVVFLLLYNIYLFRFYRINKKLRVKKTRLAYKLVLRGLYVLLFLIALAGPSIGSALKEIKEEGRDIFIAVDLSRSMNATDIAPSRLQRVKFELKNLVRTFSGDRLGLIIFSSEAFLQCPLTFDQNVLQLHIDGLNTDLVPNQGTDIAAPLAMALDRFRQDADVAPNTAKTIILISDGEDWGENLPPVIDQLREAGISVFSLGVGTEAGSTIPEKGSVLLDRTTRQPAITILEADNLKMIANQTEGQYFELSDVAQEMPLLIQEVQRLEGAVIGSRTVEASANKYFYFLLAGLVLAFIDMIYPVKTIAL